MLGKWPTPCTAPESTSHLLLSFLYTRARSAAKFSLSYLSRIQKRLRPCKPLAPLSVFTRRVFRRTTLLSSSWPNLRAKTCHATHITANHLHFLRIPLVRFKFDSSSFFPRTTALWDRPWRGCFHDHHSLSLLTSRLNRCFAHISASPAPLHFKRHYCKTLNKYFVSAWLSCVNG